MRRRTVEKAVGDPRLRLYDGKGYFYFSLDDGEKYVDSAQTGHSVYVCRLTDLSLDSWVRIAREFIAAATEEEK